MPDDGYAFVDRIFLKYILDERDLPFMHFFLQAILVIAPIAIIFYIVHVPWYFMAPYVPFNVLCFMDRFILLLHNFSHRPLFRKKYRPLNHIVIWLIAPLFGEAPETYFVHHIGMHHVEENLRGDLSSTMPYRRDSVRSWLLYFFRFAFGALFDISMYLARTRRRKLLARFLAGELGLYCAMVILSVFNFQATLFILILPFIISRFVMIAGNWSQHAFIDPHAPDDPFRSSVTLINCRYNRRCFNDGYHTGHHRFPHMHWTDMPAEFQKNIRIYKERKAVIFQGIDYLMIWALLMMKRYRILAKHFVDLETPHRSQEEIIRLLQSRTAPIG